MDQNGSVDGIDEWMALINGWYWSMDENRSIDDIDETMEIDQWMALMNG